MKEPKDYKDALKAKLLALKKDEAERQKRSAPKPLPRTVKRPEPPPARQKSDEELFLEAVKGVDQDAVLKKYDEAPPPAPPPRPVEEKKREEEALFESFVGPLDRKLPAAKKRS
jgi:hypothetical protein